jgi:hypothetical protein
VLLPGNTTSDSHAWSTNLGAPASAKAWPAFAHAVEDADDYLLEIWTFLLILDQLIAIKGLYLGHNAIPIICLVGGDGSDVPECKRE